MPTQPGLARLKALEILADGEWHDYRNVIREVAAAIPPGVAVRTAEARRQYSNTGRQGEGNPRKRYAGDTRRQIEIGSRSIARDTLLDATTFEIVPRGTRTLDGPKQIRLIPTKVPPKGVDHGQ